MAEVAGGELRKLTAFSSDPEGGNPAGVWIGGELPSDRVMQEIAADVGFSETAFLARTGHDGQWTTRYFAPATEVTFCGHATIASGVVLGDRFGDGKYQLVTVGGVVPVTVRTDGGIRIASLTSVQPEHEPAPEKLVHEALHALGWDLDDLDDSIPPVRAFAGAWHLVLAVLSRQRLASLDYDFNRLKQTMTEDDLTTLQLIYRESRSLYHSRNPFPVGGVVEDPATGAAAAALGGYLRNARLEDPPFAFTIRQGFDMGRPSVLSVEVPSSGGVVVSGPAVDLES